LRPMQSLDIFVVCDRALSECTHNLFAVFRRSAASNLRLRPRYHLYNNIILCIEFAPLREGF
jgi:hypothetical protein